MFICGPGWPPTRSKGKDCSLEERQVVDPKRLPATVAFCINRLPVNRCETVKRGVLSPLAVPASGSVAPRFNQCWLSNRNIRWQAPPLSYRLGCGGGWGACIDTRCASIPGSQLPERLGRAELRLLAASVGWLYAYSCGKPSLGWRSTPLSGVASDSLDVGGGTLSENSRKSSFPLLSE